MNTTPPYAVTNEVKLSGLNAIVNKQFLKDEEKRMVKLGWRIKLETVKKTHNTWGWLVREA